MMLNFTVGPVQMDDAVLSIGGEQIPYFRTHEFSQVTLQNEALILSLLDAPQNSRALFITGSGTASMEAVVMNVLSPDDKAIVIQGGAFGRRFGDLCRIHGINHSPLIVAPGKALKAEALQPFEGVGYSALLVNVHETSTGVLFDLALLSDFCNRNNMLLVVDAISSFLADPFSMSAAGADAVIIGSQKALACAPGVSILALSDRALKRVEKNPIRSMYLDLKVALLDGERGQTPFTPAVGTFLQINRRLNDIATSGGAPVEVAKTAELARSFRSQLAEFPFEIASECMSNALTPIRPTTADAISIFETLKDDYGIWICPSGGKMARVLLRVGHIGDLTLADNQELVAAFHDMVARGLM